MASSISILSLFVLVLISGYFTFPLDNFSSESSPLSFQNEFTTEHSFNARATVGDDFFTTPSEESVSSVTEPFSLEYTTITTDIKRSVDDRSDIFATTVEYEFTTDAERRERMTEDFSTVESSTFTDITEETPKGKREMEPTSDIVEEKTTERVEVVENSKRELEPVPSAAAVGKELKEAEPLSEFTTFVTTLFTSTSSDVAPEFYTHTSTEFSPIELTTQKYVGSLHKDDDDEEHEGDRKPKPHEKEDEERKPEKEQKRKAKKEERKPEEEEERKPKKEERKSEEEEERKPKKEERKSEEEVKRKPVKQDDEEQQHETSVDSDKTKDSKKKVSKSDKTDSSESGENSSKEKYATGQLLDQDSSKSFQQRPQGFAILVEPDVFLTSMTNELAEKQRFTTESTKLAQGEESTQTE